MKKLLFLSMLAALLSAPIAQARVGGGRSFGSRGSRGTAPRYAPPPRNFGGHAYRSNPAPGPYAPRPVQPPSPLDPRYGSGGGFWHGLAGGLAGGLIGSWIFGRHSGYGYDGGYAPGYGGGFFGIFEILILLAIGYLAFRWFRGRQYAGPVGGLYGSAPAPIYSAPADEPAIVTEDPDMLIARYESDYQREAFLEARTDDFFRIQAAFMARDLASVRSLLAPEVTGELEREIAELQASGRLNRLENITVRQTDLAEAWEEAGKLYATVHFKANLLDYVVDEKTGAVVGGSRTEPVKFEEYWTFERGIGFAADSTQWRLGAIQQS